MMTAFRILSAFLIMSLAIGRQATAQNITPHWAKKIHGSINTPGLFSDLTTDKHGNVYGLAFERGLVDIGGQFTTDSNTQMVLVSWDCVGNLRWVKALGGPNASFNPHLEVDTSEGVYLFGDFSGSVVKWDADTSLTITAGTKTAFLMKYNSLGQMQWFRTPVTSFANNSFYDFSVTPSGELYWLAYLQAGTYNGFSIPSPKYYVVRYNSSGSFQTATPLDITVNGGNNNLSPKFQVDPVTNRFYVRIHYAKTMGNVMFGNTAIIQPVGLYTTKCVLGAFNSSGSSLWTRQASTDTVSQATEPVVGNDGTVYLGFMSHPGVVFLGDTTKTTIGSGWEEQIIALDSNGIKLWTSKAASKAALIQTLAVRNNVLAVVGVFNDTLYWGNKMTVHLGLDQATFLARLNTATGAPVGLEALTTTSDCKPNKVCVDKNNNIYVGGFFDGKMSFAADTFSAPNNQFDLYLAKYKYTNCNCNLLTPAFLDSATGIGTYKFTYSGQLPYATISWDFGDGTPGSSSANPTHVYSQPGTYPACVTVTNGCGSNTTCKFIVISTTDVADVNAFNTLRIYPNPAQTMLSIEGKLQGTQIVIFDVLGRCLKQAKPTSDLHQINIQDLPNGSYILRVIGKDGATSSKTFVKQ